MDKKEVKLDVNNMFVDRVGKEHGLTIEEVNAFQDKVSQAHNNIKKDEPGFMKLPFAQAEIVKEILQLVEETKDRYDNFVVLGIGVLPWAI